MTIKKKIEFFVEKSSVNYKIPKHFTLEVIPYFVKQNIDKVLDFGAGRYLILTKILVKHFSEVLVVETKKQREDIFKRHNDFIKNHKLKILEYEELKKSNQSYNLILLSNVLHIVPFVEKRIEMLNTIEEKLVLGGYLYIKCAGEKISHVLNVNHKRKFGDGYAFIFRQEKGMFFATFRTGFSLDYLNSFIPQKLMLHKKFKVNSKEISIVYKKV